jgi:hypothetical protein
MRIRFVSLEDQDVGESILRCKIKSHTVLTYDVPLVALPIEAHGRTHPGPQRLRKIRRRLDDRNHAQLQGILPAIERVLEQNPLVFLSEHFCVSAFLRVLRG